MNSLVVEFYKLLKQEKRITDANFNQFSNIIVKFAKQDLGVKNVEVSLFDGHKKHGGYCINSSISINKNRIKTKSFYSLINSVCHETRHIYQKENQNYKEFNKSSSSPLRPIFFNTESYFYINENNMSINPFDLYVICFQEFDARDYATKMTNKFLMELKELASKDTKNFFISTLIDLQLYLSHKEDRKEARKLKSSTKCIDSNANNIKNKAYYFVKDCLKELELSNKNTVSSNKIENNSIKKINLVLQFYYDNDIKDLIVKNSEKFNDPYLLSSVVNCMFSSVSEKEFDDCIKMFVDNNNSLVEIRKTLSNWNEKQIEQEFNKICKLEIEANSN